MLAPVKGCPTLPPDPGATLPAHCHVGWHLTTLNRSGLPSHSFRLPRFRVIDPVSLARILHEGGTV